ncbi:hypothetical protein L207DRAFT_642137 [Hyaloscypha variabilis F]|uniref:Mid2 domain-containing protein n=1 Tax=Hyaloscypha variabilis (strain UAMH 11265 / GT02V1 / F) TaxID=1149755 RepID=A0A2J6QU51_HYAVF|nr:hypothetical protein L207DRAFT_642137 [Hyaloscypha variabilis F]
MATTPTPSLFTLAIISCLVQFRANAYIGGVPLRTPGTCPAGSVVGEVTFEQNCCGANQTFVKVEGSVCCPDSVDCYAEVVAAPQCADPSWQLCGTNSGGFCCEADWVCYTQVASGTLGAGVGCSAPGATLTSGLQSAVVTVYAANAGPGASTPLSAEASVTSASATASIISGSFTTTFGVGAATSTGSTSSLTTGTGTGTEAGPRKGTTTFSSSSAAPTVGSTSGASNQTSSSDSSISATKKSSISGGTIAGIAIGAAILLGAAFVGGVWFSRKKGRNDPLMIGNPSRDSIWAKWKPGGMSELGSMDRGAELQGDGPGGRGGGHGGMSELEADQRPADQQPVEMYAEFKR